MSEYLGSEYLGGGVYVEFDGDRFVVEANVHEKYPCDTIYLDLCAALALIRYIEGVLEKVRCQDCCPVCNSEIELSDGGDGKFYIYCPSCGPIPELADVTELSDTHVLGYPPVSDI